MSTNHQARLIYGFEADTPVTRDRKTGKAQCLGEWLEDVAPSLQDITAGPTNGETPVHFVGVVIEEVDDFMRSRVPFRWVQSLTIPAGAAVEVAAAKATLVSLGVVPADAMIGFWLLGEGA